MRELFRIVAAAAALLAVSTPAYADWHEAKSRHFIIYADENPKRLQEFASRLEKFDQAARHVSGLPDPPVGDGNRLTVFVLPTVGQVQALAGEDGDFLEGFYTGRASGSLVYLGKSRRSDDLGAEAILYHEYAHHLMMQQLSSVYPEWYVEGFAEFFSTPKFNGDGSVTVGTPPRHRAWGLFNGRQLPLDALLGSTYGDISKLPDQQRESIYGRGWLLTHYLFMEPERQGQVSRYVRLITDGTPPLQAASSAFGDLNRLDKLLESYLNRRKVLTYRLSPELFKDVPIGVKPLSQGAAEVILLRARLKMQDDASAIGPLAAEIRKVHARFPGDELVELTLAEAELKAERYDAAEAAADRALMGNPRSTEAMILKGRALVERAALAEEDSTAQFAQARELFIAANKLDTEDPEPLLEFYASYLREGRTPTANALEALHYASKLAPQDLGLRMSSAVAYLNVGKLQEARLALAPIAYAPHGGSIAAAARTMVAKIDKGNAREALESGLADLTEAETP